MSKSVKNILKIVSYGMIALLLLLAFLLAGVRLLGLEIYTVLSPSMEPNYPTGSLIYVKEVDPAQLQEQDVITFRLSGESTATHRIIGVNPENQTFRTKGDNNDTPDGRPVAFHEVIGTPVFCVPLLGYLAAFIQAPPGIYFAAAFVTVVITLAFAVDLFNDKKTKNKNKQEGEPQV